MSVTVPACALPTGSTVTLYPVTVLPVGAPGVPSTELVNVAGAITWDVPPGSTSTPSAPLTLTFTDSSIAAGDVVYAVESGGLVQLATATAGTATISLTSPQTIFVIATPSAQATLTVSAQSAQLGTAITLQTTGGSGTGTVSYAVVSGGTASGCAISGAVLSATSAGTCLVQATKLGAGQYLPITSASAVETFTAVAPPVKPVKPVTIGFTPTASTLSAAQRSAIARWLVGVHQGSSIVIYGFAWKDPRLALARATAIRRFILSRMSLHVRIVPVSSSRLHAARLIYRGHA